MNKRIRPLLQADYTISKLSDLQAMLSELKEKGILLLVLDVDQTLILGKEKTICKEGLALIEKAKKYGLKVAAASNNFWMHKKELAKLDLDGLYAFSCKPLPFLFYRLKKRFHLESSQIAICGDQRLTDILGGNIAGTITILNAAPKKEMRLDQKLIDAIERKLIQKEEKQKQYQ